MTRKVKRNIKKDKSIKALHAGKRKAKSGVTYYESRPNRSDKNRTTKLKTGGKVGKKKSLKLLKPHPPTPEDKARKSKSTGYRFKTTHLKKKNGKPTKLAKKLHFKKPTAEEIEKYKKNPDGSYPNKVKEIYHERRADRKHSDDNLKKKFEDGGRVGWLSVDEVKEKLGRPLHWWKDDFINLGGTVYEKCFMLPFYKPVKIEEEKLPEPVITAPEPSPSTAPQPAINSNLDTATV